MARYLADYPWLVEGSGRQEGENEPAIHMFADSDWAGCHHTRRSTSGGLVVLRGVAIKQWSCTQASVALSSGEAEYFRLARAASEGLGVQALA